MATSETITLASHGDFATFTELNAVGKRPSSLMRYNVRAAALEDICSPAHADVITTNNAIQAIDGGR
ncbi:hypothetical protein D3C84_667220 [compost metagenome]